jgi:5-methylcytosine-specific restriction protein A
MVIPKLSPVARSREYNAYSNEQRGAVVRGWLFAGKTHRELDRDVLGLTPAESRGYQAMGILHFLGLKAAFRGIFAGMTVDAAVAALRSDFQETDLIVQHLIAESPEIDIEEFQRMDAAAVAQSRKKSSKTRKRQIKAATSPPEKAKVVSYTYRRNADVVAEALFRANGNCEACGSPAPFTRAADGTPYLEVHHVQPLSTGGLDTLDNVVALCPNCHRKAHFG